MPWQGAIRQADFGDADDVARLAAALAMSFEFSAARFRENYPALLAADGACLLLAVSGQESVGYLLGFRHLTFYANGPVGWVEEIVVLDQDRGQGIGRVLMDAFEQWAAAQGCALVALATRRAGPFYRALGYEESATYYRKVLDAERARRLVFSTKTQPGFLTPPPEHIRLRLQGMSKLADGAAGEANEAFQQANSQLPDLKGSLNDQAFDSLRDGDDCLGSVLEVFSKGQYFWVPLEQVQFITMNVPRFPRDLLWIPAHLEMQTGDAGSVFLPALYPGTEQENDPQLKLGRLTDWRGEAVVRGVGVKTFFVGSAESSILDWRKLELNS